MLLFFVYFVVTLGGITQQKARTGTADYAMWSVVGSLAMFIVASILSIISGLIRIEWLIVVFGVAVFSFVWLALSKRGGEI